MQDRQKYYGTFGTKPGLRDHYVVVKASSAVDALRIMNHHFGSGWSMVQSETDFQRHYFPGGAITLTQAKAAVGQYYKAAYQEVT